MEHTLPPLPYAKDALQPHISAETLEYHYGKHHAGYVTNLNNLIKGTEFENMSLEEIVKKSSGGIFNNSAQVWNHTFFWTNMRPAAPAAGGPSGALAAAIDQAFGGLEGLKDKFVKEGVAHFGSGWVWLAAENGQLRVLSTHDGDNLVPKAGLVPLLLCDLWEHAYYLDHKNDRESFLKAWFDTLPNWPFAEQQFQAAQGQGDVWRHPPQSAA